jgi:hypothetical protein
MSLDDELKTNKTISFLGFITFVLILIVVSFKRI